MTQVDKTFGMHTPSVPPGAAVSPAPPQSGGAVSIALSAGRGLPFGKRSVENREVHAAWERPEGPGLKPSRICCAPTPGM